MRERYGITQGQVKPRRKVLKGITPANIYQAAALQFSFAALPQGQAVGQHVMAKDMRAALNDIDVIDFDTEELESRWTSGLKKPGRSRWIKISNCW